MGKKTCGCGRRRRRHSEESLASEEDASDSVREKWPLWKKVLAWSIATLLILIFVAFLLIWAVIPISFWLSNAFQRLMIFIPIDSPKNPNFANPQSHGIDGVHNFYISVSDYYDNKTITRIGVWIVLPEKDKTSITTSDVSEIIRTTEFDVLVYLHGVYANRAKPILQYGVLRKNFLVIAVDHRGYGDSGPDVEMTEEAMIHDHLQIYDWIVGNNFKNNIYYWGHSLGAALSCRTVRALKEEKNFVPTGLVLESAFTTLAEEIVNTVVGKIFKWLPYFHSTVLNPLDDNGFHFYSTSNILLVDCPIMMMHADDDGVIPSFLGARLADVAKTQRDISKQGNVTFHLFAAEHGYGHNDITSDPNIPKYISEFKEICESFIGSS